jgi:hypothetical protein
MAFIGLISLNCPDDLFGIPVTYVPVEFKHANDAGAGTQID